jgi:hypothetical protein
MSRQRSLQKGRNRGSIGRFRHSTHVGSGADDTPVFYCSPTNRFKPGARRRAPAIRLNSRIAPSNGMALDVDKCEKAGQNQHLH